MKRNRDLETLNIQAFIKYIVLTGLAVSGYLLVKPYLTLITLVYMLFDVTTLAMAVIMVKILDRRKQ